MLVCTAGASLSLRYPQSRTCKSLGSVGNTSVLNSRMRTTVIGLPFSYLEETSATEPIATRSVLTWVGLCNSSLGIVSSAEELADNANAKMGNQRQRIVLLISGRYRR
jgi:hypothetical protein